MSIVSYLIIATTSLGVTTLIWFITYLLVKNPIMKEVDLFITKTMATVTLIMGAITLLIYCLSNFIS